MIDIQIKNFSYGFDIDFENGDLVICKNLDTAIYMSIYCEKRADESEVTQPEKRRGHFSNMFYDNEVGSLFWLYTEQAKITEENASELEDTLKDGLSWLVNLSYASDVEVDVATANNNQYEVSINLFNTADPSINKNYNFTLNAN